MATDHSNVAQNTNAVIEELIDGLAGTFESEEFLREVVTQSVLRIQRIPSMIRRGSLGGRPVRWGSGNKSAIKSHCSSVSRCRSMMNPFIKEVALASAQK